MMAEKKDLELRLVNLKKLIDFGKSRQRLAELTEETLDDQFWNNPEKAIRVNSEIATLQERLDAIETVELILLENSFSQKDLQNCSVILDDLENSLLFSQENDSLGAVMSIHAGTGGVDAMDFAGMMLRMYLKFFVPQSPKILKTKILGFDRSKWQIDLVNKTAGEAAGIKTATIIINGFGAYGLLKLESGVHRLVRRSPFNAKHLRQTSFALVEVLPLVQTEQLGEIPAQDLRVDVFRASGHGGQSVNTTDSAVRITHLPTAISVSVQNERSQHQNRETALQILRARLADLLEKEKKETLSQLRGDYKEASWGNQIRSYIIHPYKLVKDHRTDKETADIEGVLNGKLEEFIEAEIKSYNL